MSDSETPTVVDESGSTPSPSGVQPEDDQLSTEDLLSTHDMVGEWIRFADAKAAVVLTVAGAVASMLIPTFEPDIKTTAAAGVVHYWITTGLFIGWAACLGTACFWAFRCIDPFMDRGRHPSIGKCGHYHPAAISQKYTRDQTDEFVGNFNKIGESGFRDEVLVGLLIDSHISSRKYNRVTKSIRLLGLSVVCGLIYGFLIQFRG